MSIVSAYPLPSAVGESAQETARLEALHHIWILELGSPSLRPFPSSARTVLDIGCGTGVWARTLAAQYPETSFIGVDVNPPVQGLLQSASNNNCRFVKANVEEEWAFIDEPGTVDYTLARMLTTAIRDWQGLYNKAFAATRPGGYFESQETWIGLSSDDDEKFKDSPILRWFGYLRGFMSSNGVELDSIDTHGERLEAAGFKIIAERPIKWWYDSSRSGMKGKEKISQKGMEQVLDFLDIVTPRIFANSTTISLDEGMKLAADAKVDIKNNSARAGYYTRYHARVAQKPYEDS